MLDALRFLTTLPLPRSDRPPPAACVRWFPLAGLVVGLAWAASAAVADLLLGALVAAVVVLIVDAVITGGLHLDATADVADGVASRRPPAEAVAIMREPGIGALGAAALLLVCLLRAALLVDAGRHALALITVPVAGRLAMVALLALVPARPDGSLAGAFQPIRRSWVVVALAISVAVSLLPALDPNSPAPLAGLVGLLAALLVVAGYGRWWRSRFGPLTGDGVGAGGMLAETIALLALALQFS